MDLFGFCCVSSLGVLLNDFSPVTQFTIFLVAICCDMEFMCFSVKLEA